MTKIPNLKTYNLKNQKVVLQLDFNNGLEKFEKTLSYLKKQKSRLIIIGSGDQEELGSLSDFQKQLQDILGEKVVFIEKDLFRKTKSIKKEISENHVLLKNLSFYSEENNNNSALGKKMAELGDFYINDSFKDCVKKIASINQIPRFLSAGAGFDVLKEIEALKEKKEPPVTVIIGGDNIEQNIPWVVRFLHRADHILIGAELTDYIMRVKGIRTGEQWPLKEETITMINSLDLPDPKLHFPIDLIVSTNYGRDSYSRQTAFGSIHKEENILNIGPETVGLYSRIINSSNSVIWFGALGDDEDLEVRKQNTEIVQAVAECDYSLVGGSEAYLTLRTFGLLREISHFCYGGEAMMEFLSKGSLPGIEALGQDE